jgi:hypothetical protein
MSITPEDTLSTCNISTHVERIDAISPHDQSINDVTPDSPISLPPMSEIVGSDKPTTTKNKSPFVDHWKITMEKSPPLPPSSSPPPVYQLDMIRKPPPAGIVARRNLPAYRMMATHPPAKSPYARSRLADRDSIDNERYINRLQARLEAAYDMIKNTNRLREDHVALKRSYDEMVERKNREIKSLEDRNADTVDHLMRQLTYMESEINYLRSIMCGINPPVWY